MDKQKMIFTFGSNEGGHHGLGAARTARLEYGAEMGVAFGLTGQSFAIPTKDKSIRNTLSLVKIQSYVDSFTWQAFTYYPKLTFKVTRIGCGLAGLRDMDIAPMFINAPDNCCFDTLWKPWLGEHRKFWGTFP